MYLNCMLAELEDLLGLISVLTLERWVVVLILLISSFAGRLYTSSINVTILKLTNRQPHPRSEDNLNVAFCVVHHPSDTNIVI